MLPTLTIPSVAPPPRTGEPANSPAAEGDGGDAFAVALQRAQGEPQPARTKEPPEQKSKSADAHAHATHHTHAQSPAREDVPRPAGDAACSDVAASTMAIEPATADAATRPAEAAVDAPATPASPMIAIDAAMAPQAVIDANCNEPHRLVDNEDLALAIDDRAALGRPGSRTGGPHEWRAGPSMPGRAALPNEPASAREGTAALSPRAALERTSGDATAAGATLRAPAFERQALEPSATPVAAIVLPRDINGAAANVESKLPQATLHTAIDEPGFGSALGTQVGLWVRDGVQEARLQLHPAELGPVTVQIALEGRAAHVDFTAAVAATRESIEQSLPALAAALRESGFTLTGGGVSSQSGQRGDDGRHERAGIGHGNLARADVGADTGHAAAVPRRWTRSLLDVYV